jgi:DNA polymerase III subunit epsilon
MHETGQLSNNTPMKRKPKLVRPLAIFDLETTGTVPGIDRIVEIGILKVYPDGRRTRYHTLVNPGIPIPREATEVHGITNLRVKGKPKFRDIARKVRHFLGDCDLAGFNAVRFDIPMLQSEFERARVRFSLDGRRTVDALRIFHLKERRDLAAAYFFYCGKKHMRAHSALGDARVCWKVLQAQLVRYRDLPLDLDDLHDLSTEKERFVDQERKFEWRNGDAAFAFGEHRGRLLKDVVKQKPDYLQWMLGKDFSEETKRIVTDALNGKFPLGGVKRPSRKV